LLSHVDKSRAAGHFHVYYSYALYIGTADDFSELIQMSVKIVKFGASHQQGVIFEEILMEAGIGKWNTIRSQHEVGLMQKRGTGRNQGELNWTMAEHRW